MKDKIYVNARFLTQPITGTQRFAIELSLELKKLLPQLVFLCPDKILHHSIAEELNVKIIGKSKNGLFWEQVELPLFLKEKDDPLLVNLCNLAPLFYSNNLVTILDLSFLHHPEWFSRKSSLLYNFIIPKVALRAKHIVTISEYSKEDISKTLCINLEKISTVYPYIPPFFLNRKKVLFDNPYGNYILSVSSIDPRKNFVNLIKAFKQAKLVDTKLLIVGQESKTFANADLKMLIENDPTIVFTGYIEDYKLIQLYENAKIFVYPSLFEGFGIPPLEAMACDCPTLVSNTTSLPEVCKDASEYVDPNDVESICYGIKRVLDNEGLQIKLREKGRERVQYFKSQNSAHIMASLITSIVRD